MNSSLNWKVILILLLLLVAVWKIAAVIVRNEIRHKPDNTASSPVKDGPSHAYRKWGTRWRNNTPSEHVQAISSDVFSPDGAGMTWQVEPVGGLTWEAARDYCDGLTLGGFDDWRLPSITDLRKLIRNCKYTIYNGPCGVTQGCFNMATCSKEFLYCNDRIVGDDPKPQCIDYVNNIIVYEGPHFQPGYNQDATTCVLSSYSQLKKCRTMERIQVCRGCTMSATGYYMPPEVKPISDNQVDNTYWSSTQYSNGGLSTIFYQGKNYNQYWTVDFRNGRLDGVISASTTTATRCVR